MPPKKKDKESSHEFPIKIAQAIEKYCQNNPNTYAKDQKAYEFAVYTTLDKKFYETNEWKPYEDNGKQKALGYIGNYISKYIPEYQKQSLLNQLLPEEQRVQQLLQVHKDHNKHTESVPAKNSREIGEQILALDAMSRFFSKTPYSSLVYKVGEKSTLYLGVNSDKKDIFLQKINEKICDKNPNVQDIATAFKNYIQEQNHQNIQKLLQCLQTDVNPILGNILKVLAIKPNTKIISLSEKDQKIIINKLISEEEIKFITQYSFYNKNIVASDPYGHAEMNALAHARGLHSGNRVAHNEKHYIIGLASANYGKIDTNGNSQGIYPFSCMGCSSEIEVLRKEEALDISIGYTSIDSMQYSEYYRPSLNIICNPKLTNAWCIEIEQSINNPEKIKAQRIEKQQSTQDQNIDNYEESKEEEDKDIKVASFTTPEELLKVIQYYPKDIFAENAFKPTNYENEKVDWQQGLYSEAMILLLLRACNQSCLVLDAINTVNVRIIRETLDNKLNSLDAEDIKEQLSYIAKANLTMDNKLKEINVMLQAKYGYFKTLFKLDLDTEALEIEAINSIYAQLSEKFKTENKVESLKNCKTSAEYSLYQMTEKEFFSDKIKDFMMSNKNYIIIPINIGDAHWTAFIVERDTKKIFYIDPKGDLIGEGLINEVFKEVAQTIGIEPNVDYVFNTAVQFDDYNCGPLLVEVISRIIKNENLEKIGELCKFIRNAHKQLLTSKPVEDFIAEQVLYGSKEDGEEKDINWINSYFGKYTLDAIDHILSLRINDLQLKDIKILQGIFIDQNHNNISNLLSQILDFLKSSVFVPLNLFNKHAAGLIFEKSQDNTIQVKYLDSLNKSIPQELKQLIINNLGSKVNFQEITVEQQKYANCGTELIENFVLYLTGYRVSQEKAIELHSKLVENALLDIKSSGIHLLFEEPVDYYQHTENYVEENKYLHAQFYNADYDNHQLDLLGHHNAV